MISTDKKRRYGDGQLIKNSNGTVSIRKRFTIGNKSVRKLFTGKNQAEVKKKILEYEEQHRLTPNIENANEIVPDYMEKWAELYKLHSVKPSTYESIENSILRVRRHEFGSYSINQLDVDLCQQFINELVADEYSLETIKKTYNHINSCLKKAVSRKDIAYNPMEDVELPTEDTVLKKASEIKIFGDEDIKKICATALKTDSNGNYVYQAGVAILFILYTGVRVGECVALSMSDVDFEKNKVTIRANASLIKDRSGNAKNKRKTIITTPKTKRGERIITLSNNARRVLSIAIDKRVVDNEIIFQSKVGTRLTARNIDRCFDRIQAVANTERRIFGVHSLRHTFASTLLRRGVDVSVVSKLLGHAKVSTTYDVYTHIIEEQKEMAVNILDQFEF